MSGLATADFSGIQRRTAGSFGEHIFLHSCDIAAETVPVCTLAELEAAEISGKVPVFYGDLAQESWQQGWYLCLGAGREESFRFWMSAVRRESYDQSHPACALAADRRFRSRHPIGYGLCLFGLKLLRKPGSAVRMKIVSRRSPAPQPIWLAPARGHSTADRFLCSL